MECIDGQRLNINLEQENVSAQRELQELPKGHNRTLKKTRPGNQRFGEICFPSSG
jgi:hypothetical protein